MEQKRRSVVEIIGFLAVYTAVYLLFIGPALGAALPGFDRPAFGGPSFRPTGELPTTGRGWLLIILGVPGLLGYMYLRARLSGVSMQQFWGESSG